MDLHIILDIDGTLVADTDDESELPAFRPHLKEFFAFLFTTFKTVSVWSNAGPSWILPIVDCIRRSYLPPDCDFLFVRTRTKINYAQIGSHKKKALRKIYNRHKFMNKHNTLILDDTPATYRNNYGNAIGIDTWYEDDVNDTSLLDLISNIKEWIPQFNLHDTVRHTHKYAKPCYAKKDEYGFYR